MRVKNWEEKLHEAIAIHVALPFEYGKSDCYILVADCVKAITGNDPFNGARGYKTELGAAKKMKARGFGDVHEAWGSLFDQVAIGGIHRGDICIVEQRGAIAGGVWDGGRICLKSEYIGLVFAAMTDAQFIYRVE